MSLYDDMERCSGCLARLRRGGCTRWGWEDPPCERVYDEPKEYEGEEEEEDEEIDG